jgi:hypothetical protein
MMHQLVADAEGWWRHLEKAGLASKYGVRAEPPGDRPRGMRGFTIRTLLNTRGAQKLWCSRLRHWNTRKGTGPGLKAALLIDDRKHPMLNGIY